MGQVNYSSMVHEGLEVGRVYFSTGRVTMIGTGVTWTCRDSVNLDDEKVGVNCTWTRPIEDDDADTD